MVNCFLCLSVYLTDNAVTMVTRVTQILYIQGDSGGKVSIVGGDNIGHCEKNVHMNMCLIVNGYRDTAV